MQVKVLELVHAQVRIQEAKMAVYRWKLLREADTQTDAMTPGRDTQAGWLNLPQKDLNPFPPVELGTFPSREAARCCRGAADIG